MTLPFLRCVSIRNCCNFTRSLSVVLSLVIFLFVLDRAQAQIVRKTPKPGEIIKYKDFYGSSVFGLVIEIQKETMRVETADKRLGFKVQPVSLMNTSWQLVNSPKKKSTIRPRKWKSKDGKFEVKATFVAIEGDNVKLKKSNGKTIAVSLSGLSDKDQIFARKKDAAGEGESSSTEKEFAGLPEEMVVLIKRREMMMDNQQLHLKLAKRDPELKIGDIIKYEKSPKEIVYGVVTGLESGGLVETPGEDGELIKDKLLSHNRWWFYDRVDTPLKTRTWSSSNKKFKIKARLVGVERGDALVLEQVGGKRVNVPLAKLGSTDAAYVKRFRSRFSGGEIATRREEYGPGLQKMLQRRIGLVDRVVASTAAVKDVSKMRSITLNTRLIRVATEQLKPMIVSGDPFSLSLTVPAGMHAGIGNLCYAAESGHVALVVLSPFTGDPTLVVAGVDGDTVVTNENAEEVGNAGKAVGLSPSGRMLLVFSEDAYSNSQLELWRHENENLEQLSVVPYDSAGAPEAHFFNDENGVILNGNGDLVFFDVEDRIKPTHMVSGAGMGGKSAMQISQDQNCVFYFAGGTVYVIDVALKKCVGGTSIGGESLMPSVARVNPDGETATRIREDGLTVYDLVTGDVESQQTLPAKVVTNVGRNDSFPHLSPNLIQTVDGKIFDLELGAEIGSIEGGGFGSKHFSNSVRISGKVDRSGGRSDRGGFGGLMVGAGESNFKRDRKNKTPAVIKVDHQRLDVDEILAFAQSLKEDDFIKFGTGDSVQLNIEFDHELIEKELRELIGVLMDESGIKVVAKSDFVLEVSYKEGEAESEKYDIVGSQEERVRHAHVIPKSCTAKLSYRGETLWSQEESANLAGVWSEVELDNVIKFARDFSPRKLLDFDYPTQLKVLKPRLKKTFSWR